MSGDAEKSISSSELAVFYPRMIDAHEDSGETKKTHSTRWFDGNERANKRKRARELRARERERCERERDMRDIWERWERREREKQIEVRRNGKREEARMSDKILYWVQRFHSISLYSNMLSSSLHMCESNSRSHFIERMSSKHVWTSKHQTNARTIKKGNINQTVVLVIRDVDRLALTKILL